VGSAPARNGLAERPLVPNGLGDVRFPSHPLAATWLKEAGVCEHIVSSEVEMDGAAARARHTNDAASDSEGFTELVVFAAPWHDLSVRACRGQTTTVRGPTFGAYRAIRIPHRQG